MSNEVSNHQQQRRQQQQQPQPMKVRIIETQFVEADERQFKMVVQKFTGKNSVMTSSRREAEEEDDDKVGVGRNRELRLATEQAAPAMAAEGELDVWPTIDELYELLGV